MQIPQIHNEELERIMTVFKKNSTFAINHIHLARAIRDADFLVPVIQSNVFGQIKDGIGQIEDDNGRLYCPAFTNVDEYARYTSVLQNKKTLKKVETMSLEELFYLCLEAPTGDLVGVVINPFSHNLVIYKEKIELMRRLNYVDVQELEDINPDIEETFREFVDTNSDLVEQIKFLLSHDRFYILPREIHQMLEIKIYEDTQPEVEDIYVFTSKEETLKFLEEVGVIKDTYFLKLSIRDAVQHITTNRALRIVVDNVAEFDYNEFLTTCHEIYAHCIGRKFVVAKAMESSQEKTDKMLEAILSFNKLYEIVIMKNGIKHPIYYEEEGREYGFLFTSRPLADIWLGERAIQKDNVKVEELKTSRPIAPKFKRFGNYDYIIINEHITVSVDDFARVEKLLIS